ncbi:UDP-N-acetylmuramoyl-L-alanyl-D-glutamate--2,6-diaminopimelate ligase [Vibrio ostreicida]|uniref:UDP-N-acetylmuramoyl-L-alanyl-D-glutamate--2, 6-diaminopimelate ligase n=1 Tax=Vibrio ostreicida TaxID=526588 RepID=UPI000970B494|nr:UDP-N-acetylmuramoyl-L-alanyl-D-glutamate--2,6-diaminopimelate ligase [Vibrio ostreicida]
MSKGLTLANLLAPWVDLSSHVSANVVIDRLELDSRRIAQGATFIAIQGHEIDGRTFIGAAVEKGANAIIAQACQKKPHGSVQIIAETPIVYIQNLNAHLSSLANHWLPLKDNRLIGVTGTNGKTTITQLIAQWLGLIGQRAAVLGTAGNGFLDGLEPTLNTTGSAIEIQQALSKYENQGARFTAMEISSHGLVQGRVSALPFAIGVFSNLSRDHLDYHGTMADYAQAKLSLFTQHDCAKKVINVDDPIGAEWIRHLDNAIPVTLSSADAKTGVYAERVAYSQQGITLDFAGDFGRGRLTLPLIGEFNASNALVALATLLALGMSKQALIDTSAQLKPVLGRMELFTAKGKAQIVVDYAHTPDALEKALLALKVHCRGKLWVIFGCGGERDVGKRPMMASIAERFADRVILTEDNPRSECPVSIMSDMLAGLENPDGVKVEHDRFLAIEYAVKHSHPSDIILLAGKGHEDYQVLAKGRVDYSDRESAQQILGIIL